MTTAMTTTSGNGQAIERGGRATRRPDLKGYLESPAVLAKIKQAAGAAMRPEDLVRLALVAQSKTPELGKCSPDSVLRSLLEAAALGIKPGGLMGRGYLVPRKNKNTGNLECNFDPGWRGLVDLARRSGEVVVIEAHVVYAADEFRVVRDPLTRIEHIESDTDDPGPVVAAYAVAKFRNGEAQIEIVRRRDIDKIRALGAQKGPWASWFEEMAKKTAVRRLCKFLPFSAELEEGLRAADDADGVELDGPAVAEGKRPRRSLADKLTETAEAAPPALPAAPQSSPAEPEGGDAADMFDNEPPAREPGEEG